jgi:hypothetical protein
MTPADSMRLVWIANSIPTTRARIDALLAKKAEINAGAEHSGLVIQDQAVLPNLVAHMHRLGDGLRALHAEHPGDVEIAMAMERYEAACESIALVVVP